MEPKMQKNKIKKKYTKMCSGDTIEPHSIRTVVGPVCLGHCTRRAGVDEGAHPTEGAQNDPWVSYRLHLLLSQRCSIYR